MRALIRITQLRPDERAWGWIGPIAVTLMALVLRLRNLGYPRAIMFDETYYAKDAWSLLHHGYVIDYTQDANTKILEGILWGIQTGQPTWIVHPDGGKWLIAIGEYLFGMTPFGWRFSSVIVGSLMVLVLSRTVLRLTRDPAIATLAGLLLALDGMSFVLSRMALLDIFVAFWMVCAVHCVVADRDWIERRLAAEPGRWHAWRPWQLGAGACFGMMAASKWNGFLVLAAFGVTLVVWETVLRRRAGQRSWWAPLRIGVPAFGLVVVVAFAVYLATWTGWLIHHHAYEVRFGRGYSPGNWPSVTHPYKGPLASIVNPLRSLWSFHVMTWDFHTGSYLAHQTHPYQSHPFGWLFQWRPVSVWSQSGIAASKCGAATGSSCIREVLILGNPVVWWSGVVAYLAVLAAWVVALVRRRTAWRLSIPLVGLASTWLPWFGSGTRPIFSFYAIVILPFTIIAISLAVNGLLRRSTTTRRRTAFWLGFGAYAGLVAVMFWYFHPVWTGALMQYDSWRDRMWSKHWI